VRIKVIALGMLLAAAVFAPAFGQAAMTTIGFLTPAPAPTQAASNAALEAFRQGLADLGYVDGRDFTLEARWGAGKDDQLPALAAELVGRKVDIIVGIGGMASRAAKGATTTIPVIAAVVINPVGELVADLDRPGGNITGVTTFDPQEPRKKLELLKEVVPGLARVAFLGDQAAVGGVLRNHEEQARALGLQPQSLKIAGAAPDLEGVFEAMRRERAGAVLVLSQPATANHRIRIAEIAAKQQLPTLVPAASSDAGGLIGYGTNLTDAVRRTAVYVDKIRKGAAPADLPFEVLVRPELIVNLKTANEIGVAISPDLLRRADRIIR
jgi:putative tryptophan/tyrosine transport system substrate-binding protein